MAQGKIKYFMEIKMHFRRKIIFVGTILIFYGINSFASGDETYDKLKLMIDIMEIIDTEYISKTNPKDLAVGAIKGVVATLDPFSQYMEEKAYKKMQDETEGAFSGVGLCITIKNDFITVVSPLIGTPAYKAGILPEDRIVKIDDKSAIGMSSDEAVNLMRGKAGKEVKIVISRDNSLDEIEFSLVREKIKIETVKTTMLDKGIVYIRLTEFNAQSAEDIKKALSNYKKQDIQALILDLRNNPGGLLDSAIKIISLFVKDETIVLTTKGRAEDTKKEYFTTGNGEFSDIPFVILVNKGSASASEIVSGSMQDFKRALIIGANTFGKGSVQTIKPLLDGTALRLTTAKYYLPSGRPINHSNNKNAENGITPDVEVEISIEEEIKLYTYSDMLFSQNKNIKPVVVQTDKAEDLQDNVLNKAVSIIKENKVTEMIESSAVLINTNKKDNKKNKKNK
ncbi:MAG: S41 family peptidase [Endomicrobium sp.]|nr:S41 family peptidase [Endomicrobium sp.]